MRNYINLLLQSINVHYDDGGGGSGDYTVRIVGVSAKDLAEQGRIQEALQQSFNPTFTFTFTYDAIANSYWLFDKSNLLSFARWNVMPDIFYALATQNLAGAPVITVLKSPRETGWKDVTGTTRKPTPTDLVSNKRGDFSGAGGLLQFVQNLPAYAGVLRREGRVRDAGIVLDVYDRIITGKISVTEGIEILRANNL